MKGASVRIASTAKEQSWYDFAPKSMMIQDQRTHGPVFFSDYFMNTHLLPPFDILLKVNESMPGSEEGEILIPIQVLALY
jgi:hypothetical protein